VPHMIVIVIILVSNIEFACDGSASLVMAGTENPKPSTLVACRTQPQMGVCPPTSRTSTFNSTKDRLAYFLFTMGTVTGNVTVTFKISGYVTLTLFDHDITLKVYHVRIGKTLGEYGPVEMKTGSSYWWSVEVSNMAPGNWTVEARANSETIAGLEFAVYPRAPHLVLARPIEVTKPDTLYPGNNVTLKYTLRNEGEAPAKSVQLRVSKLQGLTLIEETGARDLPAGSIDVYIITIRADQPGNHSFAVQPYIANQTAMEETKYNILVSENSNPQQYGNYVEAVTTMVVVIVLALVTGKKTLRMKQTDHGGSLNSYIAQAPPTRSKLAK